MRLSLISGLVLAAGISVAPGWAPPARAQMESREYITLRNQIDELRHELQMVQDQAGRGGSSLGSRGSYQQQPSASGDLVAQLLTRVEALEDQVRQLRGRIDETQNQLQRQGADLNKRIDDLAFQINPQSVPGAVAPAGPSGPAAGVPEQGGPGLAPPLPPKPPAPPKPRTPEVALQEGNAALARHDYAAAEQAAREVLANRVSPRGYDAHLLLAQALSGEKNYAQAAIAFDDTYRASPKGSHAQEALLGLASSLASINEKKAACDTLGRLRSEFPQLHADVRERIAPVAQRAGCR
jgi:TolA-binding protein